MQNRRIDKPIGAYARFLSFLDMRSSSTLILEVIVAIAAFVFFFVGLYFNQKFNKTKSAAPAQLVQENHTNFFVINYEEIKKRGITQREHDVLVKMAEGLSNQEIADQLYLSESTIKTHVSNLFVKLDAKRRTQAIQTARQLKIVDL